MTKTEKSPFGWDEMKGGWKSESAKNNRKLDKHLCKSMKGSGSDTSRKSLILGVFDCVEAVQVYVRMILEGVYSNQEQKEKLKELAKTVSVEIINDEIKKEESDFLLKVGAVAFCNEEYLNSRTN